MTKKNCDKRSFQFEPNEKVSEEKSKESYVSYCQASGGGTINEYPGTRSFSRIRREMSGKNILHYHRHLRNGCLLPITRFRKMEMETTLRATGSVTFASGTTCWFDNIPFLIHADLYPSASASKYASDWSEDAQDITQKAAAKIYSAGFDGLTFAAEIHKIKDLWFKAGGNLVNILSNADNLADLWLKYRYGWRILWYDIKEISELIEEINSGSRRERFRQSSGKAGPAGQAYAGKVIYASGASGYTQYIEMYDTWTTSIRGTVVADIEPPRVSMSVVLTAWELTRFSFILDWIIDIGQWLTAMHTLAYAQNVYAASGIKVDVNRSYVGGSEIVSSNCTAVSFDVSGSGHCVETHRIPTSVSKFPQIKLDLDVAKAIDLIALIKKLLLR